MGLLCHVKKFKFDIENYGVPLCDFKKENNRMSLVNFLFFSVMSEKNYFSEEEVLSIMKETRL